MISYDIPEVNHDDRKAFLRYWQLNNAFILYLFRKTYIEQIQIEEYKCPEHRGFRKINQRSEVWIA